MFVYPIVILAIENEADRLFMQKLYEDYYRLMYVKAHEILRERNNAEDVISEAFISLINKIRLIRTLECYALTTYVVNTVRHTAIDFLRKQERQRKHAFLDDGEALNKIPNGQSEIDIDVIRREEIERIKKGISRLREADQLVLEMKYVRNMTNAEIAAELGIGVNSVPPHMMRVRRRAYAALVEVMNDDE